MKKWYWIELIGFDRGTRDFGVSSFLERANTKVEGVSILFSNMSTIIDGNVQMLRPCDASYGGYLHGEERDRQQWSHSELCGLISELHKNGVKATPTASIHEAVTLAVSEADKRGDAIVCLGSLYTYCEIIPEIEKLDIAKRR